MTTVKTLDEWEREALIGRPLEGGIGGRLVDWQRKDMELVLETLAQGEVEFQPPVQSHGQDNWLYDLFRPHPDLVTKEYDVFESHHDFVQSRWVYRARDHIQTEPVYNRQRDMIAVSITPEELNRMYRDYPIENDSRHPDYNPAIINQFEFKGMHFSHRTVYDIIRYVEYSGKYTKSEIQEVREKISIFLLDESVKNGWIMHPETSPKLPIKFKEIDNSCCDLQQNGCPHLEGCLALNWTNKMCEKYCGDYRQGESNIVKIPVDGLEIVL